MAASSLKKLGAAIAFASASRVAAGANLMTDGSQSYELHVGDEFASAATELGVLAGTGPSPSPSAFTHSTSYVTGTSTTVNEAGETTVVVVVGTTICPVTAAEATQSSVLATESSPVPALPTATSNTAAVSVATSPTAPAAASTGLKESTSQSFSTSVPMTTSTVFGTHSSTITACATAASACKVGDLTTVIVALSTTICPVTASEAANASTVVGSASGNIPGVGYTSKTIPVGGPTRTGSPSPSSALPESSKNATVPASFSSSSVRPAQSTITRPSVILTTTIPISSPPTSGSDASETTLELATGSPSVYSGVYSDATETVDVASPTGVPENFNSTLMSLASSVNAASATQTPEGCTGMDCIVVSSSGTRSSIGVSGFVLIALAAAVSMFF